MAAVRPRRHENVATVLVAPWGLHRLELALMALDLWVWPVATAPICVDGRRRADQLRRSLVEAQRGAWDLAWGWVPVWVSFGETWRDGEEPLPWAAHEALWQALADHGDLVRYHRCLGAVAPLPVPREAGT